MMSDLNDIGLDMGNSRRSRDLFADTDPLEKKESVMLKSRPPYPVTTGNGDFIMAQSPLAFTAYPNVRIHHCRYDADKYADSLYETLGIARPSFLARAVVRRRADYLAGRHCAAMLMRGYGFEAAAGKVDTGRMREPLWPPGYVGSISHTASQSLSAMAPSACHRFLGIDLEELVAETQHDSLSGLVLNEAEYRLLASSLGSRAHVLTAAFSIKEAFFKAVAPRVGRYFDFDAVALSAFDSSTGRFELTLVTTLGQQLNPGSVIAGECAWLDAQTCLCMIAGEP